MRDPRTDPKVGDILSKRKKRRSWRRCLWPIQDQPTVRRVDEISKSGKSIVYTASNGAQYGTDMESFREWSRKANVVRNADHPGGGHR